MNYIEILQEFNIGDYVANDRVEGIITGRDGSKVFYLNTIINNSGNYYHCCKAKDIEDVDLHIYFNDIKRFCSEMTDTITSTRILDTQKLYLSTVKSEWQKQLIGQSILNVGKTYREGVNTIELNSIEFDKLKKENVELSNQLKSALAELERVNTSLEIAVKEIQELKLTLIGKFKRWLVKKLTN